ncbi:MAG: hypothetical protein PHP22_03590 [Oscillospiraceae bacterium]|nr:hypothetical protein [Oscillospiraceae bacterium]
MELIDKLVAFYEAQKIARLTLKDGAELEVIVSCFDYGHDEDPESIDVFVKKIVKESDEWSRTIKAEYLTWIPTSEISDVQAA